MQNEVWEYKKKIDTIKKKVLTLSVEERKQLLDKNDPIMPVRKQCKLLNICRSAMYYKPVEKKPEVNLDQAVYLEYHLNPDGYRKIWNRLKAKGVSIGRDRVYTIMKSINLSGR